jgi:hypothetical protein
LAGPFFYNRTDRVFFQSLGEKNKKQKFVTRNQGDPMGVSGFGSFFCLWAVRARSNRWRALIGSWVTPPTTGFIEIKRGGGRKHNNQPRKRWRRLWAPPVMASAAAYRPSAAVPLKGAR